MAKCLDVTERILYLKQVNSLIIMLPSDKPVQLMSRNYISYLLDIKTRTYCGYYTYFISSSGLVNILYMSVCLLCPSIHPERKNSGVQSM